jgi:hypothetical protein
LLNAEKNAVALGREERTDGRTGSATVLAGGHGGILLWCSLAMVVAGLLFVIAKLLPKPPGAAPDK